MRWSSLATLALVACTSAEAGSFYTSGFFPAGAPGGPAVPATVSGRYSVAAVADASDWLTARAADTGCVLSLVTTAADTLTDQCGTVASFDTQIMSFTDWTGALVGHQQATEAADAAYQLTGDATVRGVLITGPPSAGSWQPLDVGTTGETEATNFLFEFNLSSSVWSTGVQENGAGSNIEARFTPPTLTDSSVIYWEYQRDDVGGGSCEHRMWIAVDGAEDMTAMTAIAGTNCTPSGAVNTCACPTGGSSGTLDVWVGSTSGSLYGYTQLISGLPTDREQVYDDLRTELVP